MRRSRIAPDRQLAFVAVLAAAAAFAAVHPSPLEAKLSYPVALTVQTESGAAVDGAAVVISVESGEPFRVEGVTDKRGRFLTKLPDFTRVYRFKVAKAPFTTFEQAVDFSTQNLLAGSTAELTVTLPEEKGPTPEALFNLGVKALQENDLAGAEAKFKEALALKPDLAPAWRALAIVSADGKRWPETLEAADKTLALAPGDIDALRLRVSALSGLGRKEEAAAALDQLAAADRSPETARILFNAGAEAWTTKNAEVATRRFEQALAANPNLYQAHTALAEVKIDAKDLEGALAELDRALALAPTDARIVRRKAAVLSARAEVKIGAKDLEGALADFDLAIELAPQEAKFWRRKVDVLKALGRADDAAAAEKKLKELGG